MSNPLNNKKVLITSGPTWVAIDAMRVISNRSSGRLGRLLTNEFLKNKARVTLIEGPVTKQVTDKGVRVRKYKFYDELAGHLNNELKKKYDIIIHAAAVSDYKLRSKPPKGKISSNKKSLTLKLTPTKKLINTIKAKAKGSILIGFKLESNLTQAKAYGACKKLFLDAHCDLVIANSLTKKAYKGFLLNRDKEILATGNSRSRIARALIKSLKGLL